MSKAVHHPKGADISFPIWGKNYVEPFLKVTLRLMLAEGNIPKLAKKTDVTVRFYTTKADEKIIRRSPQFRALEKHVSCLFDLRVEKIKNTTQSLSCMNVCQRDALTRGFAAQRLLLPFTGDVVITENLLSDAWDYIKQGYHCVVGSGLRLNRKRILAEARKSKLKNWNLSNRQAVEYALKHRHIYSRRQTIGACPFVYSAELYVDAPQFLNSRCFALAPFALFPHTLGALPKITFDDDFIDILFPDTRKIKILSDVRKEGGIFSLTEEQEYRHTGLEQKGFKAFNYADKIHHFLWEGNLGKTHLFYFDQAVYYGDKGRRGSVAATKKLNDVARSVRRFLGIFILLQNPFEKKASVNTKATRPSEKKNTKLSKKKILLRKLYERFPELFIFFFDPEGFYEEVGLKKQQRLKIFLRLLYFCCRPVLLEFKFLIKVIASPWNVGYLIQDATGVFLKDPPVIMIASLFKKIRGFLWPLFMLPLFQLGASLSPLKVLVLRFFGSRCSWGVKIHRGVYFKNPWNVVIRRNVEINSEVLFDTPSKLLQIGMGSKIGARCYLSTVRATPPAWCSDAVNREISIPAFSRINEGTVLLPELR